MNGTSGRGMPGAQWLQCPLTDARLFCAAVQGWKHERLCDSKAGDSARIVVVDAACAEQHREKVRGAIFCDARSFFDSTRLS